MEITDVETMLVEGLPHCFVKIHTDEGITGIGEASASHMDLAREAAVHDHARYLVGRDPRNVEGLWDRVYMGAGWNWGPVSMTALSGIDMALWDILGKYHGVRVCDLLGGPMREEIKVYFSGGLAGDSPGEFADSAVDVLERGYDVTKFMPFRDPKGDAAWTPRDRREQGVERLRAIRDEVGGALEIGVELHGVNTPQTAVELAELAEPFDPLFVEEPVPKENQDAMRRIRERVDVPIATGEKLLTTFDYRDFFQHPTPADIVQPDISNCGGIGQMKKIAAMAYSEFVPLAPHNSRGPVATAAAAHAMATTPNFFILEYMPHVPSHRQEMIVDEEHVEEGYYHLPDGPGLGVELDEDGLEPYEPPESTDSLHTRGYRDLWE